MKLTAYIGTELLEKLNLAQRRFTQDILQVKYDALDESDLTLDELRANCKRAGLTDLNDADLKSIIRLVAPSASNANELRNIDRYIGGHLFQVYGERTPLLEKIATQLGGLSDDDFANLDLFLGRIRALAGHANQKNCLLYVDAEQTFIQDAIESFGQQMTHEHNRNEKVIIMNGY